MRKKASSGVSWRCSRLGMGALVRRIWVLEEVVAWGERRAREGASSARRSPCGSGM